ncbi:hypothetical protein HIM_08379 [Hirsutella minnesotensis 3608]|uniref:CinA C-terminal domain-containing protein n=1 Tax=Hirsutella minnesotensis 3608 TaxID=1043627 RepID=A0A0F7ZYC6_9HYPO|nr:hypothetical protein HIM_08379 [Hirsutella minnesotensis 3608]
MACGYLRCTRSSETPKEVASEILGLLKEAGQTISVAESLTGGLLMGALTSVRGSSAAFRGGVVTYATALKEKLLNISPERIARLGVVDPSVAQLMAAGVRDLTAVGTRTTWGISTTGVAGPDTQDGKPVGMVYIALAADDRSEIWGPFCFPGDRDQIRRATVMEALVRTRDALVKFYGVDR